jgi:hypothetical protein
MTKPDVTVDRVTITVRPSAAHPDILSVQDAMRQVLDFFDLLTPEEPEEAGGLIWNLTMATTNSPFTVVGEAASLDRSANVSVIARAQRQIVAEQMRSFTSGARPSRGMSKRRRETYQRIFNRNTNGIGLTDALLDPSLPPISITPISAIAGISALAKEEREFDALVLQNRCREEIGSIEGQLLEVGTDYNQPAILVRERKTGAEIWCRVDQSLKHEISEEARFEDVWNRKRVIVRGRISFDASGSIIRVRATSVERVESRQMSVDDIKDANFTGGLSVSDYLERLREGEIGQ